MRRHLKLIVGLAVSALFVWLALRGVDWAAFGASLSRTRALPLAAAAAMALAGVYLRTVRWAFMLAPRHRVSSGRLLAPMMIGSLANNVLPARLGDLARALVLARRESLATALALGTVVYERIVDVLATLALLAVALWATPGPPWLRSGALWVLGVTVGVLVVIVVVVRAEQRVVAWLSKLAERSPRLGARLRDAGGEFIAGLRASSALRYLPHVVLSSTGVMAASVLACHFALLAMSLELPWHAGVTVTVVVSFGSMIPAAPGNLGPIQYACVVGLRGYKVERAPALAYSLVYHASQYLPVTLLGLFFLWGVNMRLGEIQKQAATGSSEAASGEEVASGGEAASDEA